MRRYLRWLLPGLGLKRWLFVSVFGVFLLGLGISLVIRINLYGIIGAWLFENISYSATMFYWGPIVAGLIGLIIGTLLTMYGVIRVVRAVLQTLMIPAEGMAEAYYQRRYLLRGPKVAAIGGGTGIPTLLRGMKQYTANLAAIVTVADDGGSSGRLRTEFGILPPGDIRNCLVALADTEPLMEKLFQYRFHQGSGLSGHPFGNLFILAMTETTGNFYDAIQACSQVLAIRGRVMPSTLDHVVLKAVMQNGQVVSGESFIGTVGSPIRRVFLERVEPEETGGPIRPLEDALGAIEGAEVIVLGPGSLFTSILPNLLVPGVADAIRRSKALKIYVCNIMTEPGETDGYSVSQHVKALIDHAGYGIINTVLVNNASIPEGILMKYRARNAEPVAIDVKEVQRLGVDVVQVNLLGRNEEYLRHDPDRLSWHIARLFVDRRVHLERTPWDFFLLRQRLQERNFREEMR
ncbi:MAG TPA: YvcK family protein [Symbiobacteriaceae bacterium]|nr:YvcK family protein [Symbiobacteriaceae bacterium]